MNKRSTKIMLITLIFVLATLTAAVLAQESTVPVAGGATVEKVTEKKTGGTNHPVLTTQPKKVDPLPLVGTKEKFVQLMDEMYKNQASMYSHREVVEDTVWVEADMAEGASSRMLESPAAAPAPMMEKQSAEPLHGGAVPTEATDFSTTNVQVEGVDEADVIKTDGEYIYYAKKNKIWIVKASPADDMKIVSVIDFPEAAGYGYGFQPLEIYVDGDDLIAIGTTWRMYLVNGVPNYQNMTRAYVYDISDRSSPKNVREVESEGEYLSSRKIDKSVYMISSSWIHQVVQIGTYPIPMFRDTAVSDEYRNVSYSHMYYFPDFQTNNYLFITGFELDKPGQASTLESYLGAGQTVYASPENMYITMTEYASSQPRSLSGSLGRSVVVTAKTVLAPPPVTRTVNAPVTAIYKFALDSGKVTYDGKQTVPGRTLNQFSMDEHDGHFRIATTTQDEHDTEINGLYILDPNLKLTGKIDDIAPDERIYSARFMGNRAYIVTFKLVDPLFVIDLSDPAHPTVLGALKIPGYSDYLHPYDENHLIGFGKDTVEAKGVALNQGMKMSLFDVTDVTDPKEKFVVSIGDRGTDSPLLYNHKALLFDKSRDLLAFPINVAERSERQKNSKDEYAAWEYGEFKFQGAYVYHLDLENGFQFRGGITHMNRQDILRAGTYSWNDEKAVERIIRIGENLFTASPDMIQSTAIKDLKDIGSVKLQW